MIEGPSPVPEIAHFIAKIVAARPTASEEVSQLIASIRQTYEKLRASAAPPAAAAPDSPQTEVASAPVRRKPGRPRRVAAPVYRVERRAEPTPVAPPAAPRLMRRAEIAQPEVVPATLRPPQHGTLRGVVRWFDLRTRNGGLRLPGFGAEVTIDAATFERAGISRLYKGQEIEATVAQDDGGNVQLVSLALPGHIPPSALGLGKTGSARRNAKPVVVEMKRDAMRRTAARIEAEHILGNGRRPA